MAGTKKSRAFNVVLYLPDDLLCQKLTNDHWEQIDWYAWIVHDMDPLDPLHPDDAKKKKHIHLVLRTRSPVSIQTIRNWLYCEETQDKPRVEFCVDLVGASRYLLHLDDPHKYPYHIEDVHTSKEDFQSFLNSSSVLSDPIADCAIDCYNGWSQSDLFARYGRTFVMYRYQIFDLVKQMRREREERANYENYYWRKLEDEYWDYMQCHDPEAGK